MAHLTRAKNTTFVELFFTFLYQSGALPFYFLRHYFRIETLSQYPNEVAATR
jgi:hypothetical protein